MSAWTMITVARLEEFYGCFDRVDILEWSFKSPNLFQVTVQDSRSLISAWTSCSHSRIGCLWKGGITVRSPNMRQPCLRESLYLTTKYDFSIESTYEWTCHPFFESNMVLHQYKRECGRDYVSFYLPRSHMEDSFLNSSIFLVLQWGRSLDKE